MGSATTRRREIAKKPEKSFQKLPNLISLALVLTFDDNVVIGSRYASRQNFRTCGLSVLVGTWTSRRQTMFSKEVIKWIIAVLANGVETLDESRRADAWVSHPTRDHTHFLSLSH